MCRLRDLSRAVLWRLGPQASDIVQRPEFLGRVSETILWDGVMVTRGNGVELPPFPLFQRVQFQRGNWRE